MGFFKKMGKLAKKKMSFKNLVKMANPLNSFKMLNPKHAFDQTKQDFKDVQSLIRRH